MKKIIYTFGLLLLGAWMHSGLYAQGFEGQIKGTYLNAGEQAEINWFIDSGKMALEMNVIASGIDYTSRFIIDPASGTLETLSESPGEMHHSSLISEIKPAENLSMSGISIQETDKEREIIGYVCKLYLVESPTYSIESWIAQGLAVDLHSFANIFQAEPVMKLMAEQGIIGFPIETRQLYHNGQKGYSHLVKSVLPGKVNNGEFEIPSGFQRQ